MPSSLLPCLAFALMWGCGDPGGRADEVPDTGALDTGQPDTGEPDTGEPDTGSPDTGEPLLHPDYWTWQISFGLRSNEMTTAVVGGAAAPPRLSVRLLEEEWLAEGDPAHRCDVVFVLEGEPAELHQDQVAAWTLSLEPEEHDCQLLDPSLGDPFQLFLARSWAAAVMPIDPELEQALAEIGIMTDYVSGADTWLDGESVAEAAGGQTHYSSAIAVDEEMVARAGQVLPREELERPSDGWYVLHYARLLTWQGGRKAAPREPLWRPPRRGLQQQI